jgi:hypothetical protein
MARPVARHKNQQERKKKRKYQQVALSGAEDLVPLVGGGQWEMVEKRTPGFARPRREWWPKRC